MLTPLEAGAAPWALECQAQASVTLQRFLAQKLGRFRASLHEMSHLPPGCEPVHRHQTGFAITTAVFWQKRALRPRPRDKGFDNGIWHPVLWLAARPVHASSHQCFTDPSALPLSTLPPQAAASFQISKPSTAYLHVHTARWLMRQSKQFKKNHLHMIC